MSVLLSVKKPLSLAKQALKPLLWDLGYYQAKRRRSQRRTLTVAMFHRVLPLESAAYAHAEQEYAVGIEEFEQSLRYFKQHYAVVSLSQVQAAAEGGAPLPDHALLITFDDGWSDNVTHAEPVLARLGLRATLFVNADAMEQADRRWWQDALVELNERRPDALEALCGRRDFFASAQALLALPLAERLARLQAWLSYEPSERQMLTPQGLAALNPEVWDIGSHGATHVPMTHVSDLEAELGGAAKRLSGWAARPVEALAFPHGRFNAEIAQRALAAYRLVFTSETVLNASAGPLARQLGRIHIPARACRDPKAMGLLLWARRVRA
jgi:peptidoglycan/xylan/chitin deacetylase (PgdA/CDA1 family)